MSLRASIFAASSDVRVILFRFSPSNVSTPIPTVGEFVNQNWDVPFSDFETFRFHRRNPAGLSRFCYAKSKTTRQP